MIAYIRNNLFVQFDNISVHEEEILSEKLSISKKNRYVDPSQRHLWDGIYRFYHRGQKRIPRPLLGMVIEICKNANLPLSIVDERPENEYHSIDINQIDDQFIPGITLAPYQVAAIKKMVGAEVGICDLPTGGGKCLGKDTPVMMFDGSVKAVQDIKIGELLMGDDSSPRKVLSICSGRDKLYRVDQKYGDSYVVNESHILSLTKTPSRKKQQHQKVDISIADYISSTNTTKHRLKGYKVPVNYNRRSVVLDPYFLGLWLGDEISTDTSFCLHEQDSAEVIEALYKYAESLGCVIHVYNEPSKANNYAIRLYEGIYAPADYVTHSENPFRKGLKYYNLLNNKHVPDDYIYNSREVRLQLLAGLIDSDGELKHQGYIVNLKNKQIVEKCCIIARSLGFRANVFPNKKKSQTGYEGQYWKLSISGNTDIIPTKISYKRAMSRIINKDPLVSGIKITEIGEGDYYGFEIDGNKRFLLGDFTVTHNTEVICGICKAISCPTVLLADQTVVVQQIKERLELRDIAEDVGIFYAGKRPNGQTIVVGSVASLLPPKPPKQLDLNDPNYNKKLKAYETKLKAYKTRRKNAKELQSYVKNAEMIIVDECVHENTFINMAEGVMTAGDLYTSFFNAESVNVSVGGQVYPVIGASERHAESIEIITERGRSLITSDNHLCATFNDGYRQDVHTKDLTAGSLLLINNSSPSNVSILDYWYFVGLFIGDGHLLNRRQIKFGVRKDFNDWKHYTRLIANMFNAEYTSGINKRGDLVIRLKSELLVDAIRSLGFEPGRKMGNINPVFPIPSDSAVVSILCGLFDSEGSSYNDHVNFDSSDKPLAKYVQILLSSIGIKSSLYIGNKRNSNKHATGWRVSVTGSDLLKFYNLVGFRFNRKNKPLKVSDLDGGRYIDHKPYSSEWLKIIPTVKLASILGCNHTKLSPRDKSKISLTTLIDWQNRINTAAAVEVNYNEAKKLYGISYEKIAKHAAVSIGTSYNKIRNQDFSYFQQYIFDIKRELSKQLVDVNLAGFAVEPVSTLKNCGVNRLIDFTVDGSASFEANGVLVHNCDKASSNLYKYVFRHLFKGRRRYGFSGTPIDPDKPVEGFIMQSHLGSIIHRESRQHLTEIGRIIPCTYYSIGFGLDGSIKDKRAFDFAINDFMVQNAQFHNLIIRMCKTLLSSEDLKGKERDGTVVLVEREALGQTLLNLLGENNIKAEFIYGRTPKRRRDEVLKMFEEREIDVLIGGKIINRGLDLKGGCENLIIASGGKLQSEFIQKIGRALRHNKKGKSKIYDIFFRCNRYLYNHSKARLQTMINAGYKTHLVFPGGKIDGTEFVRSNFRVPRNLT